MNKKEKFLTLLSLYVEGRISLVQHDEFFNMVSSGDYDELIKEHFALLYDQPHIEGVEQLPIHIAGDIVRNILEIKHVQPPVASQKRIINFKFKWAAAAVVIVAMLASAYFLVPEKISSQLVEVLSNTYPERITNISVTDMSVKLPDGSEIVLKPYSSLSYTKSDFQNNRQVRLEGEAYFDVAKNPLKPFYVYYGNVVTQVLGTSFTIKTNSVTGNVEVAVLTGKVKVFEIEKLTQTKKDPVGVVITPNKKVIYKSQNHFFETTLVDNPLPVAYKDDETAWEKQLPKSLDFNFEDSKLSEIIKDLEYAYEVDIMLSNEALNNCVFSGNVTKHNLFDKLKIICFATGSDYEIKGTKILIKGKGCNFRK